MAYLITYEAGVARKRSAAEPYFHYIAVMTVLVVLMLFAGVFQEEITKLFHPLGDPFTQSAWCEMTERIGQGLPPQEALEAFCRQILDHGRIS